MLSGSDFEKAQDNSLLLQAQREAAWRWVKQSLCQRRRAWSFLGRRILMKRSVVSRSSPRRAGFTLLEVMIASSILAFGTLLIAHSFFVNAEAAARADVHLRVGLWIEEKVTESAREWRRNGRSFVSPDEGTFGWNGRTYVWKRSAQPLSPLIDRIDVGVFWRDNGIPRCLASATFTLP